MHTQHIILAATTLAALLILIATAYLAGRKDRKNALQQAVGEALYLCRASQPGTDSAACRPGQAAHQCPAPATGDR
ncbi:hypothetical protein [Pseudomonas aeruginosa]|uniref:hypothetical protein n=1 Tax=Pseudomonas aeruginosa TaxID=287 RepID=UPI001CF68C99|nr:hypothetical protein [Pseudomonas aeruginosa]